MRKNIKSSSLEDGCIILMTDDKVLNVYSPINGNRTYNAIISLYNFSELQELNSRKITTRGYEDWFRRTRKEIFPRGKIKRKIPNAQYEVIIKPLEKQILANYSNLKGAPLLLNRLNGLEKLGWTIIEFSRRDKG